MFKTARSLLASSREETMTKAKPKTASKLYSEVRLILLREPWLTYREVAKQCTSGTTSTVQVYGGSIREEIGCVLKTIGGKEVFLKTIGGKEVLIINWSKYVAACDLYQVEPASVEAVDDASTKKREIRTYYDEVVEEVYLGLPPASKVVLAANDIAEGEYNRPSKSELSVAYNRLLSEAVEAISPADSVGEVLTSKIEAAEIRCNEAQRLVQELSLRLSVAKAQAEEEAEVLRILDELSCKPVSVIRAILG